MDEKTKELVEACENEAPNFEPPPSYEPWTESDIEAVRTIQLRNRLLFNCVKEQDKRIAELEEATKQLVREWDAHVVSLGFGRYSVTQYVLNAMRKLHALVDRKTDG